MIKIKHRVKVMERNRWCLNSRWFSFMLEVSIKNEIHKVNIIIITLIESRLNSGEMDVVIAIGENSLSDITTIRIGRVMIAASHDAAAISTKRGNVRVIMVVEY